jgi:plasmid stability protein
MDDMICNANVYSAFLEGKATKDEMRTILKKMMRDSRLMMKLNLAATVSNINIKEKR